MGKRLLRPVSTTPGLLFLFFACLYLLTYRGQVLSYDGISMYATTRALATTGSLAIGHSGGSVPGRDGLLYSKYGIAQSLVELPGYFLGSLAQVILRPHYVSLIPLLALAINPLLMALTCVFFYGIACTLAFPRRTAVVATLVLGVATSLWPYAKTDFAEPLLTASLAGAVLGTLLVGRRLITGDTSANPSASAHNNQRAIVWWAALAGVGLGVGVLTKYAALAYVPVVCIYLTAVAWRRQSVRQWIRTQAALLLPVAAGLGGVLLVDFLRFGSPFITGYDSWDHPFTTPIWNGTFGLLLGPYRGLLFYDPLLFVGLVGLPVLLRRRPREALLPVGFLLVSLVIYGTYSVWFGGSCWGPRYLVPILPYLLWPLMELGWLGPRSTEETTTKRLPMAGRVAVVALIGVSTAIQIIGITVDYALWDIYYRPELYPIPNYQSMLSTSPLLLAIWLMPMVLIFAFTLTVPQVGFAAASYPFGPPLPPNSAAFSMLTPYKVQYFWFTLLPHPVVWAIGGVAVFGGGMALACWLLLRQMRGVPVRGHPLRNERRVESDERTAFVTGKR